MQMLQNAKAFCSTQVLHAHHQHAHVGARTRAASAGSGVPALMMGATTALPLAPCHVAITVRWAHSFNSGSTTLGSKRVEQEKKRKSVVLVVLRQHDEHHC